MSRWDGEWRGYRGGQNTPLIVMNLDDLTETLIPNDERSTDTQPLWMGGRVYFVSDRGDLIHNVWSFDPTDRSVERVTSFDTDVKSLRAGADALVIERDGWIYTVDPHSGQAARVDVTVRGDFPWAQARWEDVSGDIAASALSPTGKRVVVQARGEVFTIPVEYGDPRNLTRSPASADRTPIWSPDGASVAWFTDEGEGYRLRIGAQDGMGDVRTIGLGESRIAWTPAWSPDGNHIAFVDERARLRVLNAASESIQTIDVDGDNGGWSELQPTWSPDSRWIAYSKSFANKLRRVMVWSSETGEVHAVTDPMASATTPEWDRGGRHLWFLASTDQALASGWANTSSMGVDPTFGAYVVVLREDDPTPFTLRSDEEPVEEESEEEAEEDSESASGVRIDFDRIDRRILALPMPERAYGDLVAGPDESVFLTESVPNEGTTLHKFTLKAREASPFAQGVGSVSVSADGSAILYRQRGTWTVADASASSGDGAKTLSPTLTARVDPQAEWQQIFDEAWRQNRDFFYDPGHHGADWNAVRSRYRPLVAHVRHRDDLNYVLDQTNGELAVGHSFVFGGDLPETDRSRVGLIGANLVADQGSWQIARIFTTESWNPGLTAPLDQPGMKAREGHYLLAVDGAEVTASDDPYRLFDGTRGQRTVLHVNSRPTMDGAWTETVEPIGSESALRQRAWVEDNRRRVDELSDGKLAYVWVPNTGGAGVVSFNRYYFSQQDKAGAVIDERYNGGGLLDDYMVDLMTRELRAALTNEAEGGEPWRLPAGILGPKVLLINESAGSGGDFFPWVFRHQNAGPLIGKRTWGGLVASCVAYGLMDGGAVTSPCSAVFDPDDSWIAENEGVAPDIEVRNDARSVADGRDAQLERGVREALRLLDAAGGKRDVQPPAFPTPARNRR
jgi:tricorn protease